MLGFRNKTNGIVMDNPDKTEESTVSDTHEERVAKFGLWGDTEVSVEEDNVVRVIVDRPLKDNDRIIIETDKAKAAALIARSVGGFLMGSANNVTFFDGK